jgi:hypothetical protein
MRLLTSVTSLASAGVALEVPICTAEPEGV